MRYSDSKDISVCAIWWSQHDCFPTRPKEKKKGIINRKINEFPSELIVPSQKWYFWRLFGINKKVEERKRESSDWINSGRIWFWQSIGHWTRVLFFCVCLFVFETGIYETHEMDFDTNILVSGCLFAQLHMDQQMTARTQRRTRRVEGEKNFEKNKRHQGTRWWMDRKQYKHFFFQGFAIYIYNIYKWRIAKFNRNLRKSSGREKK